MMMSLKALLVACVLVVPAGGVRLDDTDARVGQSVLQTAELNVAQKDMKVDVQLSEVEGLRQQLASLEGNVHAHAQPDQHYEDEARFAQMSEVSHSEPTKPHAEATTPQHAPVLTPSPKVEANNSQSAMEQDAAVDDSRGKLAVPPKDSLVPGAPSSSKVSDNAKASGAAVFKFTIPVAVMVVVAIVCLIAALQLLPGSSSCETEAEEGGAAASANTGDTAAAAASTTPAADGAPPRLSTSSTTSAGKPTFTGEPAAAGEPPAAEAPAAPTGDAASVAAPADAAADNADAAAPTPPPAV